MTTRKPRPVLIMIIAMALTTGFYGCEKSAGIVSSEDTLLTSVTAEVMDMELAHAVKVALAEEKSLVDSDIGVMASDGEIQLTGVVDNHMQHDQALRIVTGVAGVKVVDDKLSVKKQN